MSPAETFLTLLITLAGAVLYWWAFQWFFGGGSMADDNKGLTVWKPTLASRRCIKCGIHPDPSQMKAVFGDGWEHFTMCTSCRDRKEVLVIMVPKLKGISIKDIKPWYMQVGLREFARQTYQKSTFSTKIYISDGDRFWNWLSWPFNLEHVITWSDFLAACPNWKVIAPEEKSKIYPEISNYVAH